MTSLTKAKSWFEARLRGERLPEHRLPTDPKPNNARS